MIRKRGFTLIELLVVISILVLLMGILLPAIIKAREVFVMLKAQAQVRALADACRGYQNVFGGAAPGVIGSPPDHNGSPSRVSGAQILQLALLGCSVNNGAISSQDEVAEDFTDWGGSRHMPPFYTVAHKDEELVAHNDSKIVKNGSFNSGYGDFSVFVDYMFTAPRPVLYFRMKPLIKSTIESYQFEFSENAVYCNADEQLKQEGYVYYTWRPDPDELAAHITSNNRSGSADGPNKAAYAAGFAIISAGPDRVYFTSDDITSY